jgi:hypothetical protein
LAWRFNARGNISSITVDSHQNIYFGSSDYDHGYYMYSVRYDGKFRWRYRAGGNVGSPAIGGNGILYFGTGGMSDDPRYCGLYAIK